MTVLILWRVTGNRGKDDTARMKLITGYVVLRSEDTYVPESFHLAYRGEDVLVAVTNNMSKVFFLRMIICPKFGKILN